MGLGHAQEDPEIAWSPDHRLSWDDFKGRAPQNDRAAAVTASGISYGFSTSYTNGKLDVDFKVSAYFYPDKSWYRPHLCDSTILSHEQLHFDISELYARKLGACLAQSTFTQNIKQEVKTIYREILKELEAYQNQYDGETDFSRDKVQQALWNTRIKEALQN